MDFGNQLQMFIVYEKVNKNIERSIRNISLLFLDEVCTIDTPVLNGHYTPIQQVYYPDQQIRIECNPGYELDRLSPVQICLKNGTWSPLEIPRCLSKKN